MIQNTDSEVYSAIKWEELRQAEGMELIASENYQSSAVLKAQSSHLANKYAEWFPGKRYYWWQEFTDKIESLAIERAKEIFWSDHANVQWLSGAAANLAIYAWLMEPGDSILGMDLNHGWHLTHGAPVTFFSKVFNFHRYGTTSNWAIDFDRVGQLAMNVKPKIILAGFSAYPRNIDYARFAEIGKESWAIMFADMSHIWGFIAAWILDNPLDHGFHVMMTTTHKSLRWPRWALILSQWTVSSPLKKPKDTIENIPTRIDRAVFPGMQGGPHMNTISAIAIALKESKTKEFEEYAIQTLKNAKIMAEEFLSFWYKLVTGWTDNHMIILDFSDKSYNGRDAERCLDKVWISTSKSTIPNDPNPPFKPSGLRIWMAAMTTRGVKGSDTKKIVSFIDKAFENINNDDKLGEIREDVRAFCLGFLVPGIGV